MMRAFLALCALGALAAAAPGCGGGGEAVLDCYSTQRYRKISQPSFDTYIMNVRAGLATRVDIYIQMQYERLRFVKTDTGYAAAYTMLFVIKGSNEDDPAQSREVARSVFVRTYDETVSLNADAFLQSFTLAPGTYTLECSATDQNSLVRYVLKREIQVCNFATDCKAAGTMLLLLKPRSSEKGIVLRPLFPQTLWYARDSIGVFQEIYGVHGGDTVTAMLEYRQTPPSEARRSDITMSPPYTMTAPPCPRTPDSVVFAEKVVMKAETAGTLPLVRYYPIPPVGFSELVFEVRTLHAGSTDSARSELKLFRRKSLHAGPADFIEVMRYIARPDEWETLQAAASDTARLGAIARFWDEHGGAARRAEFESRVDEADRLFSECVEGSRSPMGVTYIVCGPPEAVDCRTPYAETWFYTVENQTMIVPFRIERRSGDNLYYELPAYSVSDMLWRTFVDRWRRH